MTQPSPYSVNFDLGSFSDSREQVLSPPAEARARIAAWAGLEALDSLEARIRLSRVADNFYTYDGQLEAELVQSCVVTLEPVRSRISREFSRRFHLVPKRRGKAVDDEPPAESEDESEVISHPLIDLAAPVLEELSLAIDPYPRAPGVVFSGPAEVEEAAESPFAVLENLKGESGRPRRKSRKP